MNRTDGMTFERHVLSDTDLFTATVCFYLAAVLNCFEDFDNTRAFGNEKEFFLLTVKVM